MTHNRTSASGEVTRAMVQVLWDLVLDGPDQMFNIHDQAEAFLSRADAESPVVNWGLTDLHSLTRAPGAPRAVLLDRYAAWRAEVYRYESDPQGWMRRYFEQIAHDFAARYGPERAARFENLIAIHGVLEEGDARIDDAVRDLDEP